MVIDSDENERIARLINGLGLEARFVGLAGLSSVLDGLSQKKVNCTMLLGTHGILSNGDLLCKTGTQSLVLTAQYHGVKVVVFSVPEKFVSGDTASGFQHGEYVGGGSSESGSRLWNIPCISPTVDRIPVSLVDYVAGKPGELRLAASTDTGGDSVHDHR
jgi:translation initiation factor 2B subunit (eIF-2B alpha/beta/delta family)